MGLINKIKTMFTEEVEEEPIKKEVMQVEIKAPEKAEIIEPVEKKEEKFNFPIYFDDKDFENLEKPKERPVEEKRAYRTEEVKQAPKPPLKPAPKKVFKASPIISPVYGILDKNYHKEDITTKQYEEKYNGPKPRTIDDVRKKAYGTLEDDLENNLMERTFFSKEVPLVNIDDDIDLFEELDKEISEPNIEVDIIIEPFEKEKEYEVRDYDSEIEDIVEVTNEVEEESLDRFTEDDIDSLDEPLKEDTNDEIMNDIIDTMDSEEEKDESLTEKDLFELVDMMYEKRDDQ